MLELHNMFTPKIDKNKTFTYSACNLNYRSVLIIITEVSLRHNYDNYA